MECIWHARESLPTCSTLAGHRALYVAQRKCFLMFRGQAELYTGRAQIVLNVEGGWESTTVCIRHARKLLLTWKTVGGHARFYMACRKLSLMQRMKRASKHQGRGRARRVSSQTQKSPGLSEGTTDFIPNARNVSL